MKLTLLAEIALVIYIEQSLKSQEFPEINSTEKYAARAS